jgi:hypothetical protein
LQQGTLKWVRQTQLSTSEIMTIMIHSHQARHRDFKPCYTRYVQVHLPNEFPCLAGYTRLVELTRHMLVPFLACFYHCEKRCTGISFIEMVNDQLKSISQIEHTRHRSPTIFLLICSPG